MNSPETISLASCMNSPETIYLANRIKLLIWIIVIFFSRIIGTRVSDVKIF
jgi:hypothetical protein